LFFNRRWQWQALLAVTFAFAGVVMIFGGAIELGNWRLGDIMALLSGLAWAVGAALVYADATRNPVGLALWTFVAAAIVGAVFAPLTGDFPQWRAIQSAALPAVLSGALYLAPIVVVTLWGAFHLPPATISFLLTAEIVVGLEHDRVDAEIDQALDLVDARDARAQHDHLVVLRFAHSLVLHDRFAARAARDRCRRVPGRRAFVQWDRRRAG